MDRECEMDGVFWLSNTLTASELAGGWLLTKEGVESVERE